MERSFEPPAQFEQEFELDSRARGANMYMRIRFLDFTPITAEPTELFMKRSALPCGPAARRAEHATRPARLATRDIGLAAKSRDTP